MFQTRQPCQASEEDRSGSDSEAELFLARNGCVFFHTDYVNGQERAQLIYAQLSDLHELDK